MPPSLPTGWTYRESVTDGIRVGATRGAVVPSGSGPTVLAMASAVAGYQWGAVLVGDSLARGVSVRACLRRAATLLGSDGLGVALVVQFDDVAGTCYTLALADAENAHIALRKGTLTTSEFPFEDVDEGEHGVLGVSDDTVPLGEWVHLRLDAWQQDDGSILLTAYRNDLDAHPIDEPPVWESIPGISTAADSAAPYTTGRAGMLIATTEADRAGEFSHFEARRQLPDAGGIVADPFTAGLAAGVQGRTRPSTWTPPGGEYVETLGHAERLRLERLTAGEWGATVDTCDRVVLVQDADFDAAKLLRFRARTERSLPVAVGVHWEGRLVLAGVPDPMTVFRIPDHAARAFADRAVDLQALGGAGLLEFDLALVSDGAEVEREVEIPALHLDLLTLEDVPDPAIVVCNRLPEPGWDAVAHDEVISIDAWDTSGGSLDTTDWSLWINGVLAHDGTGWQAGYAGGVTVLTRGLRVQVTTHPVWTSEQVVTVRLLVNRSGGGDSRDLSWTFTAADTVGPVISSVIAREARTLRVTFNEAVRQVDDTNGDDGLNPENYTLAPQTVPAYTPVIDSIETVSAAVVDILLAQECTAGVTYNLIPAHIKDTVGNITAGAACAFPAYQPPQPIGRRFDYLRDICDPFAVSEDESGDFTTRAAIIQDVLTLLLMDMDNWIGIIDLERMPERFIDRWLAALKNPFKFDLSVTDKRRLLGVLIAIYLQKGTDPGIINAIRFFVGVEVTIATPARDDVWVLEDDWIGDDTDGNAFTADPATDYLTVADAGNSGAFPVGDAVEFDSTGTLPAPLQPGVTYYVKIHVDGTAIMKVSATPTGAAIGIDDAGTGVHTIYLTAPGGAMLGPDEDQTAWIYGFEVVSPVVLTDAERQRITKIVNYMKPGHTHYMGLIEP